MHKILTEEHSKFGIYLFKVNNRSSQTVFYAWEHFQKNGKKSNVVPIHKKESKNLIKTIDLSIFFPYSVKFLKG